MVLPFVLLLSACGGSGNQITDNLAAGQDAPREFSLRVLDESFLGSSRADFSMVLREDADTVTAVISIDEALDLRAAYINLDYDPARFSPLDVKAEGALANPADMLSLSLVDRPGTVAYGEVLINPDAAAGFNGSARLAEISFRRVPFLQSRKLSSVPSDSRSETNLVFPDGSKATWFYYNTGDYDQNGEVNVSDLTPIGRFLHQSGNFPEASIQSVVDYDRNGEINISDVTGIGIGFGNTVSQYNVYASPDIADYPASNTAAPTLDPLFVIPFSEAMGDRSQQRLYFELDLPGIITDAAYWLRPFDGSSAGTPSPRVPYEQIPDFTLQFFQVDHEIDNDVQDNSDFGQVAVEFTGRDHPRYFNLNVDGTWVLQNIPVIPFAGVGVKQTVTFSYPLPVVPGDEITQISYGATMSDGLQASAPAVQFSKDAQSTQVRMFNGQATATELTAGVASVAIGTAVDGSHWAVQGMAFPNVDADANQCVPAAVANSLALLKQGHPTEMGSVPDSVLSLAEISSAVGFSAGSGTAGINGKASWPALKSRHLEDNQVPVATMAVPLQQGYSGNISAADCELALQAIADGKVVELQGSGHAAAVTAMARLDDGSYAIYVVHDALQGEVGGQLVEQLFYDPAALDPVAHGAWGFDGRNLFGFVIEAVDTGVNSIGSIELSQENYFIDSFEQDNSAFGHLEFTYEQTDDALLYLNFSVGGEHQIVDLPLRSGDNGVQTTVSIPFSFDITEGSNVFEVSTGRTLTTAPTALQPAENLLELVGSSDFRVDSGENGIPLSYAAPGSSPLWNITASPVAMAFHPLSALVNQQAGSKESAPVAISNSLELLKALNPDFDADLNISPTAMMPATNWTSNGVPAGPIDHPDSWWNYKKQWMNDRRAYPVQTEFITDRNKLDTVLQAVDAGYDVELRVPGHAALLSGAIKLANGEFIFEIMHDTDQSDDMAGTVTELVRYDPLSNLFSGRGWINGKQFTDGGSNGALFITESLSSLNIDRTDIKVDGNVIDLSSFGELKFQFDASTAVQYFNLVVNGEWKVRNLPITSTQTTGIEESRTVRFPFSNVIPGQPMAAVSYGWELGSTPLTEAPQEEETSIVDPAAFNVGSAEDGVSLLSPSTPAATFNWLPVGVADFASHPANQLVNQQAGSKESAPTAVSNALKQLQNANINALAGLDLGISDMKPATGWTLSGSFAGASDDPSSWWNEMADYLISNDYPVLTEVKTRNRFDEIIDDVADGLVVELRVPGHSAVVASVVELTNGDLILWVAHDANQLDAESGTTIEPVYYDLSAGSFHGNFWVEGRQSATDGGFGALFIVQEYLDLSVPIPMYLDISSMLPGSVPGIIPDGYVGLADLRHAKTGQWLGTIAFEFYDPGGALPGDEHISWQNGPLGPVLVFNNIGGPQQLGLRLLGVTVDFAFSGYGLRPYEVEFQIYNAFQGFTTNPAGTCDIAKADFTLIDQFNLGPCSVPGSGLPNIYSKFVTVPPLPNDFHISTVQSADSLMQVAGLNFQFQAAPIFVP
ncbi:hypothetical protein KDL29_08500 [bacterium]|nr:hypothetical protein [bacterium]